MMTTSMNFASNMGVFICSHVFEDIRPVLLVVHDGGDWQCLCGGNDHNDNDGHLIGIGHLIERDHSIDDLHNLSNGWEAERSSVESTWICKLIDITQQSSSDIV